MINQVLDSDGNWIDGSPTEEGQEYRVQIPVGEGFGYEYRKHSTISSTLEITVVFDSELCTIEHVVLYTITLGEPLNIDVFPLSIMDRNGNHVTNLACKVTDGQGSGTVAFDSAGDYTVTNNGLNYHHNVLTQDLVLTTQPWIRVCE